MDAMILCHLVYREVAEQAKPDNKWVKDLVVTVVGAFIGSAVTVWALYRTFRKDKEKDEEKHIQFQRKKIKYFQALVISTTATLKLQLDAFKKMSEEILKNPLYLPLLGLHSFNDLERAVHKINQEDYYLSYIGLFGNSNETVEEFRKIYSALDYFDESITMMKESLKKSQDFDYQRKIEFQKLVEKSMDDAANATINPDFAKQTQMLEIINSIILNFYKNKPDDADIEYFHENFVKPMKIELIKYGKIFPEINNLITELKNSTYIYSNIKKQNLITANDFNDLYIAFRDNLEKFAPPSGRLIKFDNPLG